MSAPAPTPGARIACVQDAESAGDGQSTASPADTPSAADIAGIVERTRMEHLLQLDAKIAALKLKRECLASQVRNEMQRDGVLSHKITGVGTFKLYPPKTVTPCEKCMEQFGFGAGEMDPYLGVYPEVKIA